METEPDLPVQRINGRMWQPGQSGNPAGRPVGSRGRAPALMDRRRIGRIQRDARRALLVAGRPLTSREIACWIYRTAEPERWHVGQARMSAHRFCEPVERHWPWLWRLK